jgi:hypothetical protein
MAKLRAATLICSLVFLPLILPCQTSSAGGQAPASASGTSLSPAAREKIIQQAQQAYYNLPAHGLKEFHCQVLLDWEKAYKNLGLDATARDQLLPIMKKVEFGVVVGPTGASSISHRSDVAPPNEETAQRMRQYQTVNGFQLPQTVNAAIDLPGGGAMTVPLTFANCRVNPE